jgi:nickel ABC transporter, nickel/metallophore periplasmic binding protein
MQKYKWIAVLMSVLLISSGLAGCGGNGTKENAAGPEKTLTLSWNEDVRAFNPHRTELDNQMFTYGMMYDALVNYGEGGKIEPGLAERWDIAPDGKEYTFYLRKGVKFSDGTDFTADVVKKNFDTLLANPELHSYIGLIYQIKDTAAADGHTFKLTMKNPYANTLEELSFLEPFRLVGPNAFPPSGNTGEGLVKPVGTGPWQLSEYKQGEYTAFVRNELYWGVKPKLDKVIIKVIPDGASRVIAFEKGEIDLIYGNGLINMDSFKKLKDSGKYNVELSKPTSTRYLVINANRGAARDLKVRLALQHGFNRKALVDSVFYGEETEAGALFSPDTPYCDLNLKPYAYDPEKAKALLDEAGWKQAAGKEFREKNGQPLELELCFHSQDDIQKAIAEIVQGDYQKLGVKVNLVGEELQSFYTRSSEGTFDLIYSDTWAAPYDPYTLVSAMSQSPTPNYHAKSGLPMKEEIDKKIEELMLTIDENKKREIYRYILVNWHEQAVCLPISYQPDMAVYRKNITGIDFATKYELPLTQVDIQ